MIKISGMGMTKSKHHIRSVNDIEYYINSGLPEVMLNDNSIIVFPGVQTYAALIPVLFDNKILKEDFIKQYTVNIDDIDPEKYRFEGNIINQIDTINISSINVDSLYKFMDGNIILYRIYKEE